MSEIIYADGAYVIKDMTLNLSAYSGGHPLRIDVIRLYKGTKKLKQWTYKSNARTTPSTRLACNRDTAIMRAKTELALEKLRNVDVSSFVEK